MKNLRAARAEIAIRAASIIAVERVAAALRMDGDSRAVGTSTSSVLIDFFLWDLVKRLEMGQDRIEGIKLCCDAPDAEYLVLKKWYIFLKYSTFWLLILVR